MLIWGAYILMIILFLALDLGVFNKEDHVISTGEASKWTALWVTVALSFSGIVYLLFARGMIDNPTGLTPDVATIKYITGYLIELSLSVDNVFVIAVIFSAFSIPPKFQHRVLFWGILGAIIFRAVMILFGVTLINEVDWIIYVFGVFLLYTAYKMLRSFETKFNPRNSFVFKQIKKYIPLTHSVYGKEFVIKRMGIKAATPLLVALIIIELSDIMFALDSIPAILAITADPFLVFSSNIMAILGLRSMYFLVSRMLTKFRFINYSLAIILAFVGFKMLTSHYIDIPEWASLTLIVAALLGGISISILIPDEYNL
ncbi:MAG: TerC/Alx family metal homeostasis membrane protein [Flavobacteriaceae bacterium]|nr:TerC/Alx family metal homeostasis membrane protein [Flavobacteriaceae bacterium]